MALSRVIHMIFPSHSPCGIIVLLGPIDELRDATTGVPAINIGNDGFIRSFAHPTSCWSTVSNIYQNCYIRDCTIVSV